MAKIDLTHYGPGRPPKPETLDLMMRMLKRVEKEPGIPSAKLAQQLKIKSIRCSVLARRLEKKGVLVVKRTDDGTLTYTVAD